MRYWIDTEFIEDGKTIDLISIGIVAEDGREFYRINSDCDFSKASDWVKDNVVRQLPERADGAWKTKKMIVFEVIAFLEERSDLIKERSSQYHSLIEYGFNLYPEVLDKIKDLPIREKPEIWGYYCDYDWVVFCQLFGTMMDLPASFPMYCRDIKQWCDYLGNPKLPKQQEGEHDALADAKWNKQAWEFLRDLEQDCVVERK